MAEESDNPLRIARLEGFAGYLISRAHQWGMGDLTATLASLDLRPVQYVVMSLIGDNPGISQTMLSNARGGVRSALVPVLDGLTERGYVKRVPQAANRRANGLFLTEEGEAILGQAQELARMHELRFKEILGAEGYAQLQGILAPFLNHDFLDRHGTKA